MHSFPSKSPANLEKKILLSLMLFVVMFTQVVPVEMARAVTVVEQAEPVNEQIEVKDLIAVVIDTELDKDLSTYDGLRNEFPDFLNVTSLGARAARYAEDLKESNRMTDVQIIFFDRRNEDVQDLANALENLYVNNNLVGAVFVGDIPLPVVNKNGNRFVSMFPYTDFEDKSYVYDVESDSFEVNAAVSFGKPEIWHGVMRAADGSANAKAELAEFFDKNHLYYEGVPEYANFDRKLFYGDLVNEEKAINSDVYAHYLDYLEEWEDLAYMRYNKHWANEVSGNVMEDLPINEDHPQADVLDEALEGDALGGIPDIYTKNIIDQFLIPYYKVLTPYLSQVNDFAENTGRYSATEDDQMPVDNVPVLIGVKDEYTKQYLRSVNDAIEKAVNEVVGQIEEPLPLLKNAVLSGSFTEDDGDQREFEVSVQGQNLPPEIEADRTIEQIFQRYLYYNSVTNDYYLNGVNAAVLESAKQCSVFLGSTMSSYFDEDDNFNPKAVGGEYSILTRALRSNNIRTAFGVQTGGVNTRLLSPAEANTLTENRASNGAVIEDNPAYGISAFIQSELNPGFRNAFEQELQRGDVIVKVNGKELNYAYSFDQAIVDSFEAVADVVEAVNEEELDNLEDFPYEIRVAPGDNLASGDVVRVVGNIGVEYYRDGARREAAFSFAVSDDGVPVRGDAAGQGNGPEVLVVLSEIGLPMTLVGTTMIYDFNAATDAAIFTLYDGDYDGSAGCNMSSASENGSRCFYPLASMPVLDPAGSVELIDGDFPQTGSGDQMEIFPFPEGENFENIDEVYYNACYQGITSLAGLESDSNRYDLPLYPASGIANEDFDITGDLYGQILDGIGRFVAANGDERDVAPNRQNVWFDLDALDASEIVLNNVDGRFVTLKEFSDRYGMFDGKDNDRDGIRDYEWRDLDEDGEFETKWYDFDEANVSYRIPSTNIGEISRKLLSHNSTFTIPSELPGLGFGEDLTLRVAVDPYGKTISSMILHNEPTEHTITEQLKSQAAMSLPIDNPRYVAFQSKPVALPEYEGVSSPAHYFPGDTQKIEYPNLFELDNFAQLQVSLDQVAWRLAQVPGSYKIFGENADVVSCEAPISPNNLAACREIHDEILEEYFEPVVTELFDDPVSGFDLVGASAEKIVDALAWKNMSIDDKHHYVLAKFLDPEENAYVNDSTLLPAEPGYEASFGYEAAYLVLDGKDDYFDINFNQNLVEETDPLFDPLNISLRESEEAEQELAEEEAAGGGDEREPFVDLDQFLEETEEFVSFFTSEPNFMQACGFTPAAAGLETADDGVEIGQSDLPLARLELSANKNVFEADGQDKLSLVVKGYDANGNLLGHLAGDDLVTLQINQSESAPPFSFNESAAKNLSAGTTFFTLRATDYAGGATIFVTSGGISSNILQVSAVGTDVEILSPLTVPADGETVTEIEVQTDAERRVRFSIVNAEAPNLVSFEGPNVVTTGEDGSATVSLKSSTKAGKFSLRAEVVDANGNLNLGYPIEEKEMRTVPGEVASIGIAAESNVLVANGQSKTALQFTLRDEFGNTVNNAFEKIAVFVDEEAYLDQAADRNREIVGTQIETMNGIANLDLFARDEAAEISVVAVHLSSELEAEFLEVGNDYDEIDFSQYVGTAEDFEIIDEEDVNLKLTWDKAAMRADGESVASLRAELMNGASVIEEYDGPIEFTLVNANGGGFVEQPPKKMTRGVLHQANARLRAGTVAGKAEVLVNVPGFVSDNAEISLLPGVGESLEVSASDEIIYSGGDNEVVLEARILDENGNVVETDDSTVVSFEVTSATESLIEFVEARSAVTQNGVARTLVQGTDFSGTANIVARAANLELGTISIDVKKRVNSEGVENFAPRALYTSLAGGDFADLTVANNLAQTFVNSGQVQAVSSLTASAEGEKLLLSVDGFGRVEALSDTVNSELVLATDSFPYQKVVFSDGLTDEELGEMFVVPDDGVDVDFVEMGAEVPAEDGIFVQQIGEAFGPMNYVKEDDGISIKREGETILRVDEFGRIYQNLTTLILKVAEEEDDVAANNFAILVYERGEILAAVHYKQEGVVRSLAANNVDSSYFPGTYFKMSSDNERYEVISAFTGSSTANELGIYLVDKENVLSPDQAPQVLDEAGAGFNGENKHMLLFAAGNSVGEANVPYASEAGINFGDPNVRLKMDGIVGLISEMTGFGTDIGKPIFTGDEDIMEMLKFDYNADGKSDLLLVYEGGMIRLLENEISNRRFKDKGFVLNVFGGIHSTAKIDVNNDGYDDLVVGTKEECRADEECVSLFVNEEGHFQRQPLNLEISEKALSMKAHDMNLDGCEDLVVSDTGANLRVFYNRSSAAGCAGLSTEYGNNFNFTADAAGQKVSFDIGNNFTNGQGANVGPTDSFPDIRVRLQNGTGELTYLYSNGPLNADGHVPYSRQVVAPTPNTNNPAAGDAELAEAMENFNGNVTSELEALLESKVSNTTNKMLEDSDYNGCVDSWSGGAVGSYENAAEGIAQEIENVASTFRCSGGGCSPIPYNFAFLAPDDTRPGIAALAFGTPNFPYFAPFYPSTGVSSTRFYVSPTLSGGLGTAVCFGPGGQGVCYAYAVPPQIFGDCPNFLGPVNDAIAAAKDVNSDPDVGMSTIVSNGEASAGTEAINLGGNIADTDAPISAAANVNIRIPGFPAVITDWIDRQTEEIFGKLLDLPDFYFIYPDLDTMVSGEVSSVQNFQSLDDVLSAINSLPIVQIEGKEVLVRVPTIGQAELEKYKIQAQAWIAYEEEQLRQLEEFWSCDENPTRRTLCDKVTFDMKELVKNVKKMIDKLDQIANLPNQILEWRNLESKYATQIICYLDAIMQFTGGYINKQQKTIEAWMQAAEQVVRTVRDWKVLLDLMVEYQESCDECKNDRFSKLGALLELFVVIPDPPVIPIPKWPDIIFDISQVKMGTKILWPDVVFKPEAVVLPTLPTITFPQLSADFGLNLDANAVIELPELEIPDWLLEFPDFVMPDLPDLPPLPLPQLPDLPRPPKIPALPSAVAEITSSLRPALTVLCLLKKGLVPVVESSLATEIETLTQPSVQTVLPLLKELGMQMPAVEYDYAREIHVDAKLDLGISTDFIYDAVRSGAEDWNEDVEGLIEGVNNNVQFDFSELESSLNEFIAGMEIDEDYPEVFNLVGTTAYIDPQNELLNRSVAEVEADIEEQVLPDTPELRRMAELRDGLIAYTHNLNDTNAVLSEIENYNSFTRVLVENDESVERFAALSEPVGTSSKTDAVTGSFLGEAVDEMVEDTTRMIAADINITPTEAIEALNQPAAVPRGFYVVINGQNENILNYTAELGGSVNTVFTDADDDEDMDIVYSMGGDVYLKTNYTNQPEMDEGNLIINPLQNSVSDFVVEGGSGVQGVTSHSENFERIDLSWQAKDRRTTAYQIVIQRDLIEGEVVAEYVVNVEDLENPSVPNFSIDIENGNYYATIFALDAEGNRSIPSERQIVAPQECADDDAPFPAVTDTEIDVPILTSGQLDASNSFDTSGEIQEYYLETLPYANGNLEVTQLPQFIWSDLNVLADENGDGVAWNDRINPRFSIGPFRNEGDIGRHDFILHVVDQSGNSSEQRISLNVFSPKISLDSTMSRTGIASGAVEPKVADMPFSLMRMRYVHRVIDGELKLVPNLDKMMDARTDTNGEYRIANLSLENELQVQDAAGEVVAVIDGETGNIGELAEGYEVVVIPANPPTQPTAVQIVSPTGLVIVTIYVVGDPNSDLQLGVNVIDGFDSDFVFEKLPADDPKYPGGAVLKYLEESKNVAVVDTAGNIILLDDRMSLAKKDNDAASDPLIIEMLFEGDKVAEVYVKVVRGVNVVGPDDVPYYLPKAPSGQAFNGDVSVASVFNDVEGLSDELVRAAEELFEKDVIDGVQNGDQLLLKADQAVSRAEFVKIVLNMLCIIPRDEAYEAGIEFSDISYSQNLPWYYPYVREAQLLGLIQGYTGEPDAATGYFPFKPEQTISKAEAVKIILEALELREVINLNTVERGNGAWYGPFMEVTQDLTPYMIDRQALRNNYIVSDEEALEPELQMSRGELIVMATRVIEVYNCFEEDEDQDGMADVCEEKYDISNPAGDEDEDGVSNALECSYDINPRNPDTDGGGVNDDDEIEAGTDPNNPADDFIDSDGDGLLDVAEIFVYNTDPNDPDTDDGGVNDGDEVENHTNPLDGDDDLDEGNGGGQVESGIFVVPDECNSCPCQVTLVNGADVVRGDMFFTVISTPDQNHIFSKSNEVTIQTLNR